MKTIITTIQDWDVFAEDIAPRLTSGTILALSGPLGAGKTTFVQALSRVLGVTSRPTSPTFSLVRRYRIARHDVFRELVHVDAYRLKKPEDVITLGLDEMMEEPGIVMCVEWPENISAWIKKQTKIVPITINVGNDDARTVTFSL